jgi:hypothetical protein
MMSPLQHGKRNDGLNPATDEIHCEAAEHAPSLLRRIKSAEPKRLDSLVLQKYPAVIWLRRIISLPIINAVWLEFLNSIATPAAAAAAATIIRNDEAVVADAPSVPVPMLVVLM